MKDALTCPSCKRLAITRRDFLHAPLDGTTKCHACGHLSRLDLFSRWTISCVIALVLPSVLLYGDLFYSGHLFLASMFFIFGAWRMLCVIGFPLLTLEPALDQVPLGRRQSMFIGAMLMVAAVSIDGFMAARFDPPDGYADAAVEKRR